MLGFVNKKWILLKFYNLLLNTKAYIENTRLKNQSMCYLFYFTEKIFNQHLQGWKRCLPRRRFQRQPRFQTDSDERLQQRSKPDQVLKAPASRPEDQQLDSCHN